ncbi:MAG TPA: hypothetical protein VGG14_03745 [Candidatus Sulfotelmatobacter sp.]
MTRQKLLWTPLLSIAAAVSAVEIPFFFFGTPSGHDVEFHLYSWLEVLSQWKQGVFYPRWAALAQFGYGEPRFIFYPPASWTLGAALSAIFPWVLVSSIYIWIVLVAAGAAMFVLARRWLKPRDAIFAAVLYAVNPYHLVIVYWRSAFAELLASVLLPLLLLVLLGDESRLWELRRKIPFLALLLAASWLVNVPAAVMIHYSFALLLVIIAWQRRSAWMLLAGAVAVVLGAGLAAFYLVPVAYEQKWIDIAQAVSYGVRPVDSFLFTRTSDKDHNAFNFFVSSVAAAEIVLTLFLVWCARKWQAREAWWSLAAWTAVCAVLMLSFTNPLWSVLPKLQFMQFPWRLLLCMGVPLSLLMAIGVKNWAARVALYVATLCVIAGAGYHFQPPWWDQAADLREMQDNVDSGAGYEGAEEYAPLGATPAKLDKDARRVTVQGPARAAIRVTEWKAEHRAFTADMSAPDELVVKLLNYPAWRVEVSGHEVQASTSDRTGQLLVPVSAGMNEVRIDLRRTRDREFGAVISLGTGILLLLMGLRLVKLPGPR